VDLAPYASRQVRRSTSLLWPGCGWIEPRLKENTQMSLLRIAAATTLALGLASASAAAQDGNAENGEDVFKKCRACHDVGPDAKNKVGPLLNGIIGRTSGTVEGFNYSDANKEAGAKGLVWSEAELLKYLEAPLTYMPKNKMAFAGLKDEQDRKDVIAYLKKFAK
jgi:cytochrome c